MKQEPGVSIIIPNYNYGQFVGKAIDSALGQNYPKLEVIVIDDGSTDGSREIIDGYGDAIGNIYQTNQGRLSACRAALARAQYEIVFFLDADDVLAHNAVSKVASHWKMGVTKVQFVLETIDDKGISLGNVYPKYPRDLSQERILRSLLQTGCYPSSPTSGNACSRDFLRKALKGVVDPTGLVAIDTVFITLSPLYGEVVTVPEVLGYYRIHDRNVSQGSQIEARRFIRTMRQEEERMRILRESCESLGIPLDKDVLNNNAAYQQLRLAVAKLSGARTVTAYVKELVFTRMAVLATLRSAFSHRVRVLLSIWVLLVGITPRWLSRHLLAQRYTAERRRSWLKQVIELAARPAAKRIGVSS